MAREVTFPKTRHVALSGLEQGAEAKSAGSEAILVPIRVARRAGGAVRRSGVARGPRSLVPAGPGRRRVLPQLRACADRVPARELGRSSRALRRAGSLALFGAPFAGAPLHPAERTPAP